MKNKIRKILILIAVILTILTINSNASYNASNQTTTAGSDVTISLSSSQNVQNFNASLTDSSSLQYKSCYNSSEAATYNLANGKIAYATAGNGTTNLGVYTFKAPEVTQTTTYQVKFDVNSETVVAYVTVNPKTTSQSSNNSSSTSKTTTNTNNNNNNNTNLTTQEATFTDTNKTLYSTGDINVRSSYSTSSSSVGSLKKGDVVTVIGTSSNGWSKVKYNGQVAYIKSDLLTATKPEEEEKSTNKALKSLSIEEGTLKPEFDKETTNYKLTVGKDVESLKIDAVAEDEKSKVTISGNEKLETGENTVKVLVTAEDGTVRTYTIIVTKEDKEKLQLSKLQIAGVTLNETFSPDKYEYTVNLSEDTDLTKLDISLAANDEDAIIEVLGNDNFVVGENIVTIMVKSKDGSENVTYQIVVNKPESVASNNTETNRNNEIFMYISAGIFVVALILIIIVIIRSRKKAKQDDEYEEEQYEENTTGFDYNGNYTEELYGIKQKNNTEQTMEENNNNPEQSTEKSDSLNTSLDENFYQNDNERRLYNVEEEVDFSDVDKPRRKK